MNALVVGCGLSGAVVARTLAERGWEVEIWDRRDHIGGNLYDYVDAHGIRVHRYGPHIFHTKNPAVYDFVRRFGEWRPYKLVCGAVLDGQYTPTAFNFTTIDTFYSAEEAQALKARLLELFPGRKTITVVEALDCSDPLVRGYAEFLFDKDYRPYTAKQWGIDPSTIDPSVLKRVPLRLSYDEAYFDDPYQMMPDNGYTEWFGELLNHDLISVRLGVDALDRLKIGDDLSLLKDGHPVREKVIYTGAIDELLGFRCGALPYRSLRFEWAYEDVSSKQQAPVVAYPQEPGYTRITEYKKLPVQDVRGTSFAYEYPLPASAGAEPYYPVLTEESSNVYLKYRELVRQIPNLVPCGRLGCFKYFNMDQAIEAAWEVAESIS